MDKERYTLQELSEEFEMSAKELQRHINKGNLRAKKVGRRGYLITSDDMEDFLSAQFPMRNYLCENYNTCLNKAALANSVFDCESCPKFVRAGNGLDDILPLWDPNFTSCMPLR